MTKPTPRMIEALQLTRHPGGLRRKHPPGPGKPAWPAHACTLHALVRNQLVTHREGRSKEGWRVQIWEITPAGRDILNPQYKRVAGPRSLRVAWDPGVAAGETTPERRRAPEPEPVHPSDLTGPTRLSLVKHEEARPTTRRRAA